MLKKLRWNAWTSLPTNDEHSNEQALFYRTYNLKEDMDRKLYSDQTGKFPVTSYHRNQYIMVMYEMDVTSSILVEPMRNRTSGEMVRAYQAMIDRLQKAGIKLTPHILDNECSAEFKNAIEENEMKYQLVPQNDHRQNAAEKAIQIFKTTSCLCSVERMVDSQCNYGANF